MRVFIAGGTGLIGSRLVQQLRERGDRAVILTRNAARARQKLSSDVELVEGDPMVAGPWMLQVSGCDGVINLVGENLAAHRWSDSFKKLLRDSRLLSTENIVQAIRQAPHQPKVLVQGSAIGYYGFHGDERITEAAPPGDDFLATLCVEWEGKAHAVQETGVRLAIVRTGVVFDPQGGALKQMLTPFKLYLFGGPVGSGTQYVSWVHHADEVGILLLGLDHPQAQGPINATAPNPVTNAELAHAIGRVLGRPSFFPTPGFLLHLGLGEMADLVLKGSRILPQRAGDLGYQFKYAEIEAALRDLLGKPQATAA